MAKTTEEKLSDIDQKMLALKAERQAIINRQVEKEKKERISRLIRYGELVEKYFACEGKPPDEVEIIFQNLTSQPEQ